MGSRTDEIAQQLEEHRASIGQKIDHLASRIEEDAGTVSEDVRERVPEPLDVERHMRERPGVLLLGALGLGTALGMLSESVSMPSGSGGGDGRQEREPGRGGGRPEQGQGAASRMAGVAMGPLIGALQAQVQSIAREMLGGFGEEQRRRERAQGDGHPR